MPTTKEHNYSYSGADAKTLVWFPQAPELIDQLSSVHTISVSVHEAKGQARALGHRGIKGLARGVRTIAGSVILTVIKDHPLRELHNQYRAAFIDGGKTEPSMGWSIDRHRTGVGTLFNNYAYTNRLATLLPPFNLALQYVSEAGPIPNLGLEERAEGAGCMLVGVEFLDEGQVTSVSDIVTEMTFSFIACDFKPLSKYEVEANAELLNKAWAENQDFDIMHDELMQDLFFAQVGVAGSNGQALSSHEKALAKAVGLDPATIDQERLNRALRQGED